MEARRLLYALAACSPAVLLALLAISGRFLVMPWQSPEYGAQIHREILAYRLPMMLEQSLADGDYSKSPETVQAVAQIWISGWEKGALKNIPPASGADFGGTGIRQQIEASRRRLMGIALRTSKNLQDLGEPKRSAEMLLVAMKLSEVMKYSSPVNTLQSSSLQSTCLHHFATLADSLTEEERFAWKSEAAKLAPHDEELPRLCEQLGAMSKTDRVGGKKSILATQSYQTLLALNSEDLFEFAAGDSEQTYLLTMVRGAFEVETRYKAELEGLVSGQVVTSARPPIEVNRQELETHPFVRKGSGLDLLGQSVNLEDDLHSRSSK